MEIDMIGEQKQSVILGMLWLAYHNPEIDCRTREVKMTRCPKECRKQQRLSQIKSGQQKQKEEERKEVRRKRVEERKRKKPKVERIMEIKKVAEEQKIWNEEVEVVKSEEEIKGLVPKRFYK